MVEKELKMLDGKGASADAMDTSSAPPATQQNQARTPTPAAPQEAFEGLDDDVPF